MPALDASEVIVGMSPAFFHHTPEPEPIQRDVQLALSCDSLHPDFKSLAADFNSRPVAAATILWSGLSTGHPLTPTDNGMRVMLKRVEAMVLDDAAIAIHR
jgi:hypothetical protein